MEIVVVLVVLPPAAAEVGVVLVALVVVTILIVELCSCNGMLLLYWCSCTQRHNYRRQIL